MRAMMMCEVHDLLIYVRVQQLPCFVFCSRIVVRDLLYMMSGEKAISPEKMKSADTSGAAAVVTTSLLPLAAIIKRDEPLFAFCWMVCTNVGHVTEGLKKKKKKSSETEDKLPFTLVIKCWEKRESISLRLVYQRIRVSAIRPAVITSQSDKS